MPYLVGEKTYQSANFTDIKHDYDYPDGLDLRPGSDLHKKLKTEIHQRAVVAGGAISQRFDSWNQIDRVLTTYIDLDEKEKAIKSKDERKPVSIVFPYSTAILEAVLSYLVGAFFQDPMFRYEGVGPEDIIGSIMLEKCVDLQCNKAKIPLNLHTMFRDGLSYGIGAVTPAWYQKWGYRTVKKETGFIGTLSGIFKGTGFEKDVEEMLLFEGNKLSNIDPYLMLPDPNVSIHNVQEGEFFGWVDKTNYMDLLSEEKHNEDLFNVKYIKSIHNKRTSIFGEDKSDRNKKVMGRTSHYTTSGTSGIVSKDTLVTTPVDVINMYVKLIPKDWKIGDSEYPEKWFFALAADDVIIRAQPLDLDHDLFPVAVCSPDYDGYSVAPISRLEKLYGLQGTLDWLFNMHVANVRKAINDMFIYDPYLVNSNDLKKPGPGKLIRMRRPAWGRGVKDAVMQLSVNDVTRQHIADSGWIVQWMQKIGGADESSVMGSLRQGGPERLSAKEFQGTQQAAFSKLARMARVVGLQAMQDIGYMFASHTQQLMENDIYVKMAGRWQETLLKEFGYDKIKKDRGRMIVSPFDILVDFDVKVRDGSVPGGNNSDFWLRTFDILSKNPELAQKFDVARIFKHMARNEGAKNVDEFVRINVTPDETAANRADAGGIVPMEGGVA